MTNKVLIVAIHASGYKQAARPRHFSGVERRRRVICVVFAKLGSEGISVVSMRPARLDERKLYAESLNQED